MRTEPLVFTSIHYTEGNPHRALQPLFLQWFGLLASASIVVVLLRMFSGAPILLYTFGAVLGSIALAWLLTLIQARGRWVRLRIEGGALYLQTLYGLSQGNEPLPFPLPYAAAQIVREGLQLHYHDQVVVLRSAEWPAFDEIVAFFRDLPPEERFLSVDAR